MKTVVFKTFCASIFIEGVETGPPNVSETPKPISSISTTTTLGDPLELLLQIGVEQLHSLHQVLYMSGALVPG